MKRLSQANQALAAVGVELGWPDYEVKAIVRARIAGQSDDEIRALVERLHEKRMAHLEVLA